MKEQRSKTPSSKTSRSGGSVSVPSNPQPKKADLPMEVMEGGNDKYPDNSEQYLNASSPMKTIESAKVSVPDSVNSVW